LISPKRNAKRPGKGTSTKAAKLPHKVKTLKPSDPRDWPKRGDGSKRITYAAVGEALSEWAEIEIAMTRIFFTFLDGKGGYGSVAIRAFGSVRTFEGRLEMIKSSSEVYFEIEKDRFLRCDPPLSEKWVANAEAEFKGICSDLKLFVSRRNEIAHGQVGPLFGKLIKNKKFALQPLPMEKKSSIYSVPEFAYDSAALKYYSGQFRELSKRLDVINIKLRHLRSTVPL